MTPGKPFTEMTPREYDAFIVEHMMQGWVPLRDYLRHFKGESANGVQTRVSRGYWKLGVQYATPKGGGPWVNLVAVRDWIAGGAQEE